AWLTNECATLATYFPIEHHSASYVQQFAIESAQTIGLINERNELHRLASGIPRRCPSACQSVISQSSSRILCCLLRILDTSLTSTPASAEIASSPLTESSKLDFESLVSKAAIGCLSNANGFLIVCSEVEQSEYCLASRSCSDGRLEAPEEEFADSQDAANWDAVVSQSIDASTRCFSPTGAAVHGACDPCPTVRRRLLLSKLHSGLARLRLPNDFLAAYAFVTEAAGGGKDSDFQRLACASLRRVVAKRRQFMAANWDQVSQDSRLFYSLLPEACLSTAVHLWAGDPDFREPSDSRLLARPLAGMRLLLRQLLASSSNVGKGLDLNVNLIQSECESQQSNGGSLFTWIRRLLEKIRSLATPIARQRRGSRSNPSRGRPDLRAAGHPVLKVVDAQLPFEPQLPKKLYCFQSGGLLKANNYPDLPADFRFQQPRNRQALDSGLIPASRVAVSNPDARLLTSMAGRRRKSDGDNSIISSEEEEEDLQEPQRSGDE
uniref:Sister chromatid cohesion protein n=1 Tax=Macrostomum lignano TaxID=282301 RepID=A0A1I8FF27_9PLAT